MAHRKSTEVRVLQADFQKIRKAPNLHDCDIFCGGIFRSGIFCSFENFESRSAKLPQAMVQFRVKRALALISGMKERVLKLRFGLNGDEPKTYEEIACEITNSLSPAQRWVLARRKGILPERVQISAEDVIELETQALRDIRPQRTSLKLTASNN